MQNIKQSNVTIAKEHEFCLRCGLKLRSQEARERGMGLVCWNRSHVTEVQKPLFLPKNL